MSATERKVTALAVGSWVFPLPLIFAGDLLAWPAVEASGVSVLIMSAGMIPLFVASALAARRLQQRFWPSWAERYNRTRSQTLTACTPFVFAYVAVNGAIEGDWVLVLLTGAVVPLCVYPLVSRLRGHRTERPPPSASPPSAQHP